jgi:hypothetical protein
MSEHYASASASDDETHSVESFDSDDEAGLMDYRQNEIDVTESDGKLIINLTFDFNSSSYMVPHHFAERWCGRFSALEIAEDIGFAGFTQYSEDNKAQCFFEVETARWLEDGVTLEIILNCVDKKDRPAKNVDLEELIEDLETSSLEDGPYEGCPGNNFWVPSHGEVRSMI